MTDKTVKEYKTSDNAFTNEVKSDLEQNLDKFRDPVVLAEMVYRLLEERENTNRMLKTIVAKLEALEQRGMPLEGGALTGQPMLAEVDEQIVAFVKGEGKATAEDVRAKFSYKGKNAASARLNRLFEMGLLQKQQVGKKVYFFPIR